MLIDINSLLINGYTDINGITTTFESPLHLVDFIVECEFGYNKIWSSDSGRNLAYKMTGTLGGIFPKIIPMFRKLTKEQMNIIAPILNARSQSITYYDPDLDGLTTMTSYTGDWKITSKNFWKNEGFNCSFIDTEPRD